MIPLTLAKQLKEAGLVWQTAIHDFFAIPDRGMDDRVFVISDMMVTMELLRGWPALTFHGTAEWAADYLLTQEAVWLPTEEQLRETVVTLLTEGQSPVLHLQLTDKQYNCRITVDGVYVQFQGNTAVDAYGQTLLYLLAKLG